MRPKRLWTRVWSDLKHDLKQTRWLRGFGWFGGVIWLLGIIVAAISIGLVAKFQSTESACLPDGSFRLYPDMYSMWSSSGFFQITLGGGNLTFAQAKVIDIVWDIMIGRGGQVLLALISWRVFAQYLTLCMEARPVSYQLFRTVFLETEASIPSTCAIIHSFLWRRKLRSKAAMAFIALTMLFILAFPTLTSAMSGYDANVNAYLPDRNDSFIPFTEFSRVLYLIHDGSRINLTDNHWVIDPSDGVDPLPPLRTCRNSYTDACILIDSISLYVADNGLNGRKNSSTNYILDAFTYYNKSVTLKAPSLNISAFTADDKTLGGQNATGDLLPQTWLRNGENFDIEYITARGSCQTMGNYQWGFSFLQLFIWLTLLVLWTIGIYTMWLRSHFAMIARERHPDDVSGKHRAVLELAAAMHNELNIEDIHSSLLREKILEERVDKELKGGAVSYAYSYAEAQKYSFKKGFKNWFRKEKCWFCGIFLTTSFWSTIWIPPWLGTNDLNLYTFCFWSWIWSFGPWFGQICALSIGTTTGSRVLIVLFWSLVLAIIATGIVVDYVSPYYRY